MILNLSENANWCLSGGADGADLQWGMVAGSIGHGVLHYSFQGAKTQAPASELVMLTNEQLKTADRYCRAANKTLGRRFPANSQHVTNLLRRDWYQVSIAASCYGVSTFEGRKPAPTLPLGTVLDATIKGGTAWAVQMFIDRHDGAACPCYFFDQVSADWFQWIGGWQRIYQPPKPQGIYAGIGARDLLPMGKLAVRVLMEYAKKSENPAAREQAEIAARQRFEENARLLEGHKMGAWESLSDLMREALIHHEMTRRD